MKTACAFQNLQKLLRSKKKREEKIFIFSNIIILLFEIENNTTTRNAPGGIWKLVHIALHGFNELDERVKRGWGGGFMIHYALWAPEINIGTAARAFLPTLLRTERFFPSAHYCATINI